MARKPKPTPLKVLAGARPCRVNASEPKAAAGRPDPPAHLAGDALAEWHRIVEVLDGMGVLTRADGAALAIYCVAHARWLEALESLQAAGLVIDTTVIRTKRVNDQGEVVEDETPNPKGCVKTNPAAAIATACEATMARVLGSFGLTPADRSRVKAQAQTTGSKLDKFKVKA